MGIDREDALEEFHRQFADIESEGYRLLESSPDEVTITIWPREGLHKGDIMYIGLQGHEKSKRIKVEIIEVISDMELVVKKSDKQSDEQVVIQ